MLAIKISIMELDTDLENKIIGFLIGRLDLDLLIVFGSHAKGQANNNSDLDLAYLSADEISTADQWKISQSLAQCLNMDVDLINLGQASDVFSFQIVSQGMVIYQKKDKFVMIEKYLNSVYARYMQLNQDRKEILDNYAR